MFEVMAVLSEWVGNLVAVILVAVVLEMFLPATSLRRTVSLVVGFVFVAALLGPFFDRFGTGFAGHLEEGRQLERLFDWKSDRTLFNLSPHAGSAPPSALLGAQTGDAQSRVENKAKEQALALYRTGLEKQLATLVQSLAPVDEVDVDCGVGEAGVVESVVVRARLAAKIPGERVPGSADASQVRVEAAAVRVKEIASIEEVNLKNASPRDALPAEGAVPDSAATTASSLRERIAIYTGVPAERIQVELVGDGQ